MATMRDVWGAVAAVDHGGEIREDAVSTEDGCTVIEMRRVLGDSLVMRLRDMGVEATFARDADDHARGWVRITPPEMTGADVRNGDAERCRSCGHIQSGPPGQALQGGAGDTGTGDEAGAVPPRSRPDGLPSRRPWAAWSGSPRRAACRR